VERNKTNYHYKFSNGEEHIMNPIEAHKYSHRLKIDILKGPGYIQGKREKAFSGWGWHDSLLRSFKGPKDYRDYLKEHGLVEASIKDKPIEQNLDAPLWNEELIWKAINVHGLRIDGVMAEALLNGEVDWPDGSSAEDFKEDEEEY
jgi:hypothetical protein